MVPPPPAKKAPAANSGQEWVTQAFAAYVELLVYLFASMKHLDMGESRPHQTLHLDRIDVMALALPDNLSCVQNNVEAVSHGCYGTWVPQATTSLSSQPSFFASIVSLVLILICKYRKAAVSVQIMRSL